MFGLIFEDAFNMRAGLGGLFGTAILNGVKRGLFSNEAGMGAVPNASSVADVSHPAKQGLIQALGVYLDTILICSATAFVIIIGCEEIYLNPDLRGLDITQAALATYYDYLKQLKSGKDPVFDPKNIKELSPYLDEITAWYVDENL